MNSLRIYARTFSLGSRFKTIKKNKTPYHAAVCMEIGKPLEIKNYEDIQDSQLKAKEVLLSVDSCGVNFADILICKGMYQQKADPPFIPGFEFSGTVLNIGSEVTNVIQGDRVVGVHVNGGGFAQQTVAPEQALTKLPENLSLEKAASLVCSYGTALLALSHTAKLLPGEIVLVTGAAGATGLAAMDLAANVFGSKVIGACGSQEKCDFLLSHGYKNVINYNSDDLRSRVKELTAGKGVNVVFDTVGGDLFLDCLKSLSHEGRILTIGYTSGKIPSIPANLLLVKSCAAMGVYWGDYQRQKPNVYKQSITDCLAYATQGKISPYFSVQYPLEKVNEAFQSILERKSTGRVLIKPHM